MVNVFRRFISKLSGDTEKPRDDTETKNLSHADRVGEPEQPRPEYPQDKPITELKKLVWPFRNRLDTELLSSRSTDKSVEAAIARTKERYEVAVQLLSTVENYLKSLPVDAPWLPKVESYANIQIAYANRAIEDGKLLLEVYSRVKSTDDFRRTAYEEMVHDWLKKMADAQKTHNLSEAELHALTEKFLEACPWILNSHDSSGRPFLSRNDIEQLRTLFSATITQKQ